MRMWGIPAKYLCRQHLLGEHVEMHMFVGTINKGINIQGYVNGRLVNTALIHKRHDLLVKEMRRRGFNHRSPLPPISVPFLHAGSVSPGTNMKELRDRCPECRRLQKDGGWKHAVHQTAAS